jgi:hypothetical protein
MLLMKRFELVVFDDAMGSVPLPISLAEGDTG